MITNVNKGICQHRATNNKPSLFVSWQENGERKYTYFSIVSCMYSYYDKLKKIAQQN